MSSAAVRTGLTWEEYLDLPEDPRYKHAELMDGELVPVNPPTWLHQVIVTSLVVAIGNWVRAGSGRGLVSMNLPVRVGAGRAYLPDVAWYREENARPAPGRRHIDAAPDIAVEVLSDSTRSFDLFRKRGDYAAVGVGELWLIDPEGTDGTQGPARTGPSALVLRAPAEPIHPAEFVVVDELDAGDALTSPLLPGLAVDLAGLADG